MTKSFNELESTNHSYSENQEQFGRTGYDFLSSKTPIIIISIIILPIAIYLLWDIIVTIPLYAISAIVLSFFWYNPISNWLSNSATFVEVWDKETNTFTTWRLGKDALADFNRIGVNNTVFSLAGSQRIFASYLDPEEGILETSWVHDLDPWAYHRDMRTLEKLTQRVAEVLDDIIESKSLSQIEGRKHAMEVMQKHYQQLDNLFFGNTEVTNNDIPSTETHTGDIIE